MSKTLLAGIFLWGGFFAVLLCLRPGSPLHTVSFEIKNRKAGYLSAAVLALTILLCVLPMGLSPSYNGEKPDYMNQYELLAESFLEGHLYIDYDDIDPKLLALDNPYDPDAREAADVSFHWDHTFYNGRYYMYFGVVPVFLLFLPYRFITGMSLTTYHATQIFAALFICGVFSLFYMLGKAFFKRLSLGLYLSLSAAFSFISVWYAVSAPALYCTAITAAICLEIWSFFFFIRAVFVCEKESTSIRYAFFGSLTGALAFGCRPPIALANLFVLPLIAVFLKGRKLTLRLGKQLFLAASPYIVVGALLMLYNYARFDNPFEFGQAYQLTIADQSQYGSFLSRFQPLKTFDSICKFFVGYTPMSDQFPFVTFDGILLNFPILVLPFFGIASEGVRGEIRENRLRHCIMSLFLIPLLIAFTDVLWAPTVLERYHMDVYWLLCLLCFLVTGLYYQNLAIKTAKKFSCILSVWAFLTTCKCILMFLVPYDYNFTFYYVEALEKIRKIFMLGRGVGLY
jgi:hypothetical protein